jgi:energy-coupling factor transporter ATP-binding protein EcfA2
MNLTPEQIASRLADRNPFATRCVRPGAIEYRFTDSASITGLLAALQQQGWRGEIVGPHGSGKSTLIQTLIPVLKEAGRDVRCFVLQAGESRLPVISTELKSWGASTQIIVDGYEQLGGWTRTLIQRICAAQKCGLLITTHKPAGWPVLLRTSPSLEMTQAIVREIQPGEPPRISDHDVQLSYQKHGGNIREVFFELHDLYEQRRA